MKINKKKRILIAGYEIGGQMQLLAETFRNRGVEAYSLAFNKSYLNHKNDHYIPIDNWFKRFIFFIKSLRKYEVYHFFWGVSLLSFKRFHFIDLPILKIFGKKIYCHFRGSDVMSSQYSDYLISNVSNKNSKFSVPSFSGKTQLKSIAKWKKYSNNILISTPNLRAVSDEALLFPQVIDLNYWKSSSLPLSETDGVFRIVHAPTNRVKKGTIYIEQAVKSLKKKGYQIELLLAENIETSKVRELYSKADIGIDQLVYGWYGKVSCEWMSMGIPVLCYINAKFERKFPQLPIINTSPITLEDKIEELIRKKDLRLAIGKKSIDYVSKHHDVEVQVNNLLTLYNSSDEK